MPEVFAISKGHLEEVRLMKFNLRQIVSLELTNAPYLIIGKVVLYNADGDAQNATGQLRRLDGSSSMRLDEATVRLAAAGGADRAEVSLQVGIDFSTLKPPITVELACSTYEGNASHAKLAALQLDFLNDEPR